MDILELREQDRGAWDQYVHNTSQASVYHLLGWKDVMEICFGHKTHYLYARDDDQIVGILPLIYIKSLLAGHFLTSMPGGMCARDEQVAAALLDQAKGILQQYGGKYLILRDSPRKWELPELITNEDHCTLLVKVSPDPEKAWRGIKKRARQLTNQAIATGMRSVSGADALEAFYPIYLQAMRDRGTPTLGKCFFHGLADQISDHFDLLMVQLGGQILGGGFIAPFRDTVYCTWGGMLRKYYDLHPNHLLYWETIKYGCDHNYQWVDLGRSQCGSGSYVFKMNWGAQKRQLYQQYYLHGMSSPPAVGKSMEEGFEYRLFVSIWSRLPLPLTEVIGPQLRRRMPFG